MYYLYVLFIQGVR